MVKARGFVETDESIVCALDRLVEALLFIANEPVNVADLASALEADPDSVQQAIERLIAGSTERGVCVVRVGPRVQMVTIPEAAPQIERFLGIDRSARLSPAAMETIAIIAYRQPITRAQVDAIRGVNSDGVIRTLLAKNLVEIQGHLEQAGRPALLGTTFECLQYFGLRSLEELPPLSDLDEPGD
jgi:segregation and condensation protein B